MAHIWGFGFGMFVFRGHFALKYGQYKASCPCSAAMEDHIAVSLCSGSVLRLNLVFFDKEKN